GVLLPGLIDLHAHPAREGSIFGVDPDLDMLPHGVTTVLSQGDAGAWNWPRYRETTVEAARTRVRLALNLSARGQTSPRGCFADLEDADVEACARTIEQDAGRLIWGVAVNVSHHACGATDPREVLRRALAVAGRTGRPLLYGMRRPSDWPFAGQLDRLRPGDVVTYCFRREPHGIIEGGRVHPAIRDARARRVLFDLGTAPRRSTSRRPRRRWPTASPPTRSPRTCRRGTAARSPRTRCRGSWPSCGPRGCRKARCWPRRPFARPGSSAWRARWACWRRGRAPT